MREWQDRGFFSIIIAFNITPFQFIQEDLMSNIKNIIRESGIDPKYLEIEITESGIMENEENNIGKLNDLHEMGISISIDDFGTGCSSLSRLKNYPVSILKIDKSFIDDLGTDSKALAIILAIIKLAHELGFNVVAEGVETWEQLELLKSMDCDFFQGYYFYRPQVPGDIEKSFLELKSV